MVSELFSQKTLYISANLSRVYFLTTCWKCKAKQGFETKMESLEIRENVRKTIIYILEKYIQICHEAALQQASQLQEELHVRHGMPHHR